MKIAFPELFANMDHRELFLFEGRPGSGKTTLMLEISCDWARGQILQSKLVILVQLRRLSGKASVYIHDLIKCACSDLSDKDIQHLASYIERNCGEDVVFILDGFDEYVPGASEQNFISKLIMKEFFSRSVIVISSRPAATQHFRRNATKWIEVVGFLKKQVNQYIRSCFDEEKAQQLIVHLERHPNLRNLCYLPLHCAMLVFLHKEDEDNTPLPVTETEFYEHFTLSTLYRSLRKNKRIGIPGPFELTSFEQLPKDYHTQFRAVCKLAFDATVMSKQVFRSSELESISFDSQKSSDDENSLGLITIDRYFVRYGVAETYTFLHLTFQEFLAAVYIAEVSEPEQNAIVMDHGDKEHLSVTWRFLFGILHYSNDCTVNFFKLLMRARHSISNNSFWSIQCAFESQHPLACTHVMQFLNSKITFSDLNFTCTDMTYVIYLLKNANYEDVHLSFNSCKFSVDEAVALLQGVGDHQLSLTIKYVDCQLLYSDVIICLCSHAPHTGVVMQNHWWTLLILSQSLVWFS